MLCSINWYLDTDNGRDRLSQNVRNGLQMLCNILEEQNFIDTEVEA
jgi:hypothetical protein